MKTVFYLSLLLTFLAVSSCGNKSYSLVHQISNESSRTLTFRFTNTPDLIDTVFVIPPASIDTLLLYADLGEIIPAPNCGLGSASTVTVQGGGTLTKELSESSNWETLIDQEEKVSSCTFVVRDEDIQ